MAKSNKNGNVRNNIPRKSIFSKKSNKIIFSFLMIVSMIIFVSLVAISVNALTDTTSPSIDYVSVVNNEQDVSQNEQIVVTFSEDMDPLTINSNTFTVIQRTTPDLGAYRSIAVDGVVTYTGRKATFKPNHPLTPSTQYGNVFTVTITTGAKDLSGNAISRNYVWSFTTGDNPFNTGITTSQLDQSIVPVIESKPLVSSSTSPTILYVSIKNNEQNVLTTDQILVVFNKDMDPSTINSNTFTLTQRTTPEIGSKLVEYRSNEIDGTVTYKGRTATFTPNSPLYPNNEYGNVFTVTITTGAKDLLGNSISQNYMWSFTTGDNPFNTGLTTSQLDQSPNGINEITVAFPSQNVVTPITTSTTVKNKFPWAWVIGWLFLFFLVVLIYLFVLIPKTKKNKRIIGKTQSNPFGHIHPVIDLEGIGPVYNKQLHAMGIMNTKQLWEADPKKIMRETGVPLSVIKSWQSMAELASVKDIGPQYAELLERSGVHSISQLKNYDPKALLKLVHKKMNSLKVNIMGSSPGHVMVEHWIHEARNHRFSNS